MQDLKALGYRDVPLGGLADGGTVMFLRHDVDLCLQRAVALGEVEEGAGVSSTYYVLVSADMYSIAAASSRAALLCLVELDHRVVLYFDATRHDGGREALGKAAEDECAILEQLTGEPVDSISFHRPAPALIGMASRFAGRQHSYEAASSMTSPTFPTAAALSSAAIRSTIRRSWTARPYSC